MVQAAGGRAADSGEQPLRLPLDCGGVSAESCLHRPPHSRAETTSPAGKDPQPASRPCGCWRINIDSKTKVNTAVGQPPRSSLVSVLVCGSDHVMDQSQGASITGTHSACEFHNKSYWLRTLSTNIIKRLRTLSTNILILLLYTLSISFVSTFHIFWAFVQGHPRDILVCFMRCCVFECKVLYFRILQ